MDETKLRRIRGRKLQAIRERFKRKNPLCVKCQAAGVVREWTDLDHIIPLFKGGPDTDENRQGLCDEHHRLKSAKDLGVQATQTIGADGWPVTEAIPAWRRTND